MHSNPNKGNWVRRRGWRWDEAKEETEAMYLYQVVVAPSLAAESRSKALVVGESQVTSTSRGK